MERTCPPIGEDIFSGGRTGQGCGSKAGEKGGEAWDVPPQLCGAPSDQVKKQCEYCVAGCWPMGPDI